MLCHAQSVNTTVLFPCTNTLSSSTHRTALASTSLSRSRPFRSMSFTESLWVIRVTSCSMMGPASSSAVAKCAVACSKASLYMHSPGGRHQKHHNMTYVHTTCAMPVTFPELQALLYQFTWNMQQYGTKCSRPVMQSSSCACTLPAHLYIWCGWGWHACTQ